MEILNDFAYVQAFLQIDITLPIDRDNHLADVREHLMAFGTQVTRVKNEWI